MDKIQKIIYSVRLLAHNWWKILITCVVVGILSALYIVAFPRSYTSEMVMLPEVSGGASSLPKNLGSLASMAGLGSIGSSEDAIYPEFYPKVVGTTDFLCDLLKVEVLPTDSKRPMTLFTYLTKHQKSPWWSKFFDNIFADKEKAETLTEDIDPRRPTKKQEQLLRSLDSSILRYVDKRTNMMTISVTMQDPEVATQIVSIVQEKLQAFVIDYRTSKARNDVTYMEGITDEALKAYKAAQQAYSAFADANQDLSLPSAQQQEEHLENEMQIAFNAYSLSAQQLQQARAKVQERTPALVVLQPANVPVKPTAPKRVVFVAMMLMLAFFASVMWILLRDAYKRAQKTSLAVAIKEISPDAAIADDERPDGSVS